MPNMLPPRAQAQLSDADKLKFEKMAFHLLDRTLRDMYQHDREQRSYRQQDPKQWKPMHSGTNYMTYTRCDDAPEPPYVATDGTRSITSRPSKDVVLGMGFVNCPLDELMYGVFMGDTRAMALKSAVVDQNIGKGAVLVEIVGPSQDNPFQFLGLKWIEVRPPPVPILGKMLVAPRDVVFVGGTGTMRLPDTGEYIGYEVHHSVDHEAFPPIKGLRRTRIVIGSIYRSRPDGTVDLFIKSYSMEADLGKIMGDLAMRHASSCIERVWTDAPAFAYIKKLRWCIDHREFGGDKQQVAARKKSGQCGACGNVVYKPRRSASMRRTCEMCKGLVCSACHAKESLFDIDQRFRARKFEVHICAVCKEYVKRKSALEIARSDLNKLNTAVFDPLTPSTLDALARNFSLENSFCTASVESLCMLNTPRSDSELTDVL